MSAPFDVSVMTYGQLEAVSACGMVPERICLDSHLLLKDRDKMKFRVPEALQNVPLFVALPFVCREEEGSPDIEDLQAAAEAVTQGRFTGVLVRNPEQAAYLKEQDFDGRIVFDSSVYVWNHAAYEELCALFGTTETLPEYTKAHELSLNQFYEMTVRLPEGAQGTIPVYGRTPMMVTAPCVRLTDRGCSGQKYRPYREILSLRDRTGRTLPVTCDCRYCYNVIWNAHPLSLHTYVRELSDRREQFRLRIDFTTEEEKEAADVLRFFSEIAEGADIKPPYKDYTTGRAQKGVE